MKIKSERISLLQAIIINGGAKYLTTAITLLITMVLSRLLTPENFGMISVITVFTTFFNTISDLGLSPAMIQFQGLREEEINDIYSFSVYIGFLFAFLFCFLSIPIVWFYQNEAYISICCILSIAVLFATLNAVPNALLLKEKKFLLIGIRSIVVAVTSGVISIWLAFIGFQYYALIMQMILLRIFTYLWNMKSNRLKFKFRFSKSSLSIIWKYSSYQFLFNFINFFTRNFDNLIVGKVFGSTNLAYYDKSYTLMVYPIQAVTGIITPVLHPVLVQYKQFSAILYKQYKILVSVLLIPGIFLSVFCYWSCREIILFLFGGQWEGAVNSFALLSLSIWVQLLITSTGTIFQVVNHTRLLFVNGIINMIVMLSGIICGALLGSIEWVAFFVSCAYTINLFITFYCMCKFIFGDKQYRLIQYVICQLTVGIIILFITQSIRLNISNIFGSLVVKFVICIILFGSYYLISGQYKVLKEFMSIH